MFRWVIFLPISLLLSNLGCSPGDSKKYPPTPGHAAENQFEIANLQLQEGDGEHTVWKALAKTATGDLTRTQVTDLIVTHKVQGGSNTIVLKAPTGTLSPLTHDALLHQATLEDSFERNMEVPTLEYKRKSETIEGNGPIIIDGPGFSLTAAKLKYRVQNGSMLLTGPIQGQVSLSVSRLQSAR